MVFLTGFVTQFYTLKVNNKRQECTGDDKILKWKEIKGIHSMLRNEILNE